MITHARICRFGLIEDAEQDAYKQQKEKAVHQARIVDLRGKWKTAASTITLLLKRVANLEAKTEKVLDAKNRDIAMLKEKLEAKDRESARAMQAFAVEIAAKNVELRNKDKEVRDGKKELEAKDREIALLEKTLEGETAAKTIGLKIKDKEIADKVREIESKEHEIAMLRKAMDQELTANSLELASMEKRIDSKNKEVLEKKQIEVRDKQLSAKNIEIESLKNELVAAQNEYEAFKTGLSNFLVMGPASKSTAPSSSTS